MCEVIRLQTAEGEMLQFLVAGDQAIRFDSFWHSKERETLEACLIFMSSGLYGG